MLKTSIVQASGQLHGYMRQLHVGLLRSLLLFRARTRHI